MLDLVSSQCIATPMVEVCTTRSNVGCNRTFVPGQSALEIAEIPPWLELGLMLVYGVRVRLLTTELTLGLGVIRVR